jgi:hypothetical protein
MIRNDHVVSTRAIADELISDTEGVMFGYGKVCGTIQGLKFMALNYTRV